MDEQQQVSNEENLNQRACTRKCPQHNACSCLQTMALISPNAINQSNPTPRLNYSINSHQTPHFLLDTSKTSVSTSSKPMRVGVGPNIIKYLQTFLNCSHSNSSFLWCWFSWERLYPIDPLSDFLCASSQLWPIPQPVILGLREPGPSPLSV